ncbi:uncharacterized protein PRCAT00003488001 [Priceomyces carsonii]|uniref:uncharacterized protein n=1 Tax=Priceomyces carsonii TaxID=28549 RepID=UPI002ED9DDE1|nr:unnamed protein product [Priceomyces carsonii]
MKHVRFPQWKHEIALSKNQTSNIRKIRLLKKETTTSTIIRVEKLNSSNKGQMELNQDSHVFSNL